LVKAGEPIQQGEVDPCRTAKWPTHDTCASAPSSTSRAKLSRRHGQRHFRTVIEIGKQPVEKSLPAAAAPLQFSNNLAAAASITSAA
jgi:hypothetical protein